MFLREIALQDFRNIGQARLGFPGSRHFIHGANGQGKTNLLESIAYLTALRSFRTAENRLLVREGRAGAAVSYRLDHETFGETRVVLRIASSGAREVTWDGEKVGRLGDIIGKFPAVVFSSGDIELVRGSPGVRRRWMDLLLSATDPVYFQALQQYTRTVAARNALLKRRATAAELSAFESEMAAPAVRVIQCRRDSLVLVNALLDTVYGRVSGGRERASLRYLAAAGERPSAAELLTRWASARERDAVLGATQTGPHRDDFILSLDERSAARYGSEGQQRSLVLALRFAQMEYVGRRTGVLPVVLLDDVVGELDPGRRKRFWEQLDSRVQVFATGTERLRLPGDAWAYLYAETGTFAAKEAESPGSDGPPDGAERPTDPR